MEKIFLPGTGSAPRENRSMNERLIRIDLPKRCFLLLTEEEFRRGIQRGKARRRNQSRAKREAAMSRKREFPWK